MSVMRTTTSILLVLLTACLAAAGAACSPQLVERQEGDPRVAPFGGGTWESQHRRDFGAQGPVHGVRGRRTIGVDLNPWYVNPDAGRNDRQP